MKNKLVFQLCFMLSKCKQLLMLKLTNYFCTKKYNEGERFLIFVSQTHFIDGDSTSFQL